MVLQVKIWFQNRRMKLKKELRAVKEINEQVRRERDEQEKMKQQHEKEKSKDGPGVSGNAPNGTPNGTGSTPPPLNTTSVTTSGPPPSAGPGSLGDETKIIT